MRCDKTAIYCVGVLKQIRLSILFWGPFDPAYLIEPIFIVSKSNIVNVKFYIHSIILYDIWFCLKIQTIGFTFYDLNKLIILCFRLLQKKYDDVVIFIRHHKVKGELILIWTNTCGFKIFTVILEFESV